MAKRTKRTKPTKPATGIATGVSPRPSVARRRAARKGSSQEHDADAVQKVQKALLMPQSTKANRRGTNAASLANLKKGATAPVSHDRPDVSAADADLYVKLRVAGVPVLDCIRASLGIEKRLTPKQAEIYIDVFEAAPEIAAAYERFNGNVWQDMSDEERTDAALRMHIAQCSYILYTADLSDPLANMKKIEYAKAVIVEQIALAKEAGGDDKFTQFMQQLVSNANAGLPATFKKDGAVLPALPADFVAAKGKGN